MLLSDAGALRLGSATVSKVYCGVTRVWSPSQPLIGIIGNTRSSGTTCAMPPHQAGDVLFLVFQRSTASVPVPPAPTATVPVWQDIIGSAGDGMGCKTCYAVATVDNHTSGVWIAASNLQIMSLRPRPGTKIVLSGAVGGQGNAFSTVLTYPALPLIHHDGTSFGIRVGARDVGSDPIILSTPPGWTLQDQNPIAAPLVALHVFPQITLDQDIYTVTPFPAQSSYRSQTIELSNVPV
jgi:hypothetical protein